MKKKLIFLLSASIILALTVCISIFTRSSYHTYYGYKIYDEQYEMVKERERAGVYRYFYDTYGAESSEEDFFNREYNGENPKSVLHEKVIAECIKMNLLYELGYKNELLAFQDFPGLKKALQQENKSRSKALASGSTIYGPQEYSLSAYTDYIIGNLYTSLPEKLEGVQLPVDDHLLKEYFADRKDALFTTAPQLKLSVLELNTDTPEETEKLLSSISQYQKNHAWDQIVAEFGKTTFPNDILIKDNSIIYSRYINLYEAAKTLLPRETGFTSSGSTVYLFQVLEKSEAEKIDFEKERSFIKAKYLEEKFSEYISKKLEDILKKRMKSFNSPS